MKIFTEHVWMFRNGSTRRVIVNGANIGGFLKVADAMLDQGVV
ncbi:MAG: hypothetical protein R3C26_09630 [Calditrichia bacterium]